MSDHFEIWTGCLQFIHIYKFSHAICIDEGMVHAEQIRGKHVILYC